MKRVYCTQNDGDCGSCSLVSYGRDCKNNPVYDPEKDICGSCNEIATKCICGDFVSTWPLSEVEKRLAEALEREYRASDAEIKKFFE